MFEFDKNKSTSNLEKHGIDFVDAQRLWLDPQALEISVLCEGENRFVLIAVMKQKIWTAVFTYRKQNIRIISVRRSRKKEVVLYES